jgi:hypothetical protein
MENNNAADPLEEQRAAIELWNTTCQLVTQLHAWANARPDLFRIIARQTFFWPAMVSRKHAFAEETAKLMEKIQLGKDCLYRNDTQWRINEPSTQFAIQLHALAKAFEKQWQLPRLSDDKSKRVWFQRAWHYLDDIGFNPMQNPIISKLAKRAVDRNYKADERAAIKERVWQAYDRVIAVHRGTK